MLSKTDVMAILGRQSETKLEAPSTKAFAAQAEIKGLCETVLALYDTCDALRADLELLELSTRWISVKERLPDNGTVVLGVTTNWGADRVIYRSKGAFEAEDAYNTPLTVTHWRPLPAPPSEASE